MGSGILRNCKVKLSWYRPKHTLLLNYRSSLDAKRVAERLNGITFRGHVVKARLQMPHLFQITSFTVILDEVPDDAEYMQALVRRAKSVSCTIPPCHTHSLESIPRLLDPFGPVDSYEELPLDKAKAKRVAFAQFSSPEAVVNAVKALNGQRQAVLADSPLWVEQIFSVKYVLPVRHFACIKEELDKLRDVHSNAKVRYYFDPNTPQQKATVRVYGPEAKMVARLKLRVEKLVRGE
ncbi:hypothetical protein FISHEDRAFT_46246, partial [Fistulina hepatica ATCC 64428]